MKTILRPLLVAAALATGLSGCADTTDRALQQGSPYAPAGPARGDAVDGLTVGARLEAAGEHQLALRAYYRAATELGMTSEVLTALGSVNLNLGRLGQAEELLRRAVEVNPESPAAWNNLGVVLMEAGKIAEAKEVFRNAFALDDGASATIRENLRLALAKHDNSAYGADTNKEFALVYETPAVSGPPEPL